MPEGVTEETDIRELFKDVTTGKIEKPEWFVKAEQHENYDCFTPDTSLYIIAKEKEYESLAALIVKFLYSTYHEATRDG